MKTFYLKIFGKISMILLFIAFFQNVNAYNRTGPVKNPVLISGNFNIQDTTRQAAKSTAKDKDEPEDGVDDDIKARNHQEFQRTKDPKINRVPKERLLVAKQIKDQMIREKNQVKPVGNLGISPVNSGTISSLQWTERGPNNVGGRTRALIFDMNDVANGYKKVFAGGVGGGIWYTNDITATPITWNKIDDFFDNIAISCIVQDPTNPQILYAGTGEGYYNGDAIQGLGVWKSTNDGATWAQLPNSSGFLTINSIAVDKNGSVYIAGQNYGVEQSTDGGTTWNQVLSTSSGADLGVATNGDVYAALGVFSQGQIFISDFTVNGASTGNAGKWTNITPETTGVITPTTTSWYRIQLACAPNNANIVYAFFEGSGTYSLSSVQQYNKATNKWTVKVVPPGTSFGNGQAWYSIAAAVDPNNAGTLYAGSLDAVRSLDSGKTWTPMTEWTGGEITGMGAAQYVHADHHAYTFAPGSSSRLMMGTDGGVFYTANANATPGLPTFIMQDHGYNVTQYYSSAIHPTKTNYFLAGAQDNGTQQFTTAGMNAANTVTGGDGADCFIDQKNGNIQITSYVRNNHWVSTDGGVTFNQQFFNNNGQFINPSDYDPVTEDLYSGDFGGDFFRWNSVASGGAPVTADVSVSAFGGANITSVTVSPLTANRVYFGLDNGTVVRVDNANTGTSLAGVVLNPNASAGGSVSCINVDPGNEAHLLVSYFNYGVVSIFETKNATAATPVWTSVEGNLPDMPVRWAMFYPGDPTKAIIATELGVWTTDLLNGGSTTWSPSNTGLANVEVDMLTYRASDRTIAAATHGRGLFTSILPAPAPPNLLTNLTISSGTLTPAFVVATSNYTASVANSVASMTVTPTGVAGSTIKVNGVAVTSGTASGSIALAVGANTITTLVTAQDGITTRTYTIIVTRAPSGNALLSGIKLTPASTLTNTGTVGSTTTYTTSVSNAVASVTVTATTIDPTATIKVNGVAVNSGTASASIALVGGPNTINTVVTAQDGITTRTYTIIVTRAKSTNAALANLSISAGTLSPAFATGTYSYTASVSNSTASVTVTPTTSDGTATVTVNGTAVSSGTASGSIALVAGSNTITTIVTAQDGVTTKTYTITVTRAPSTNALLSGIKLTPASTLTNTGTVGSTTTYTTSVSNAVASVTVTATTIDPTATIKVNGVVVSSGMASASIALVGGSNTINTVVTAQDGITTRTYAIIVTRAKSTNAALANLSISAGMLSPVFATGTNSYTASVGNATASVTVTPTTSDGTATVTVNGTAVSSGTASGGIALVVGANTITTIVTAQDGVTTKTYTITVTRAPSTNADLANLTTSAGTLSPVFATGTNSYTASVSNATASITVTPTTSDGTATVTVNGTAVSSGTASGGIALVVGANTITTIVTAQDGVTTKTYTITVTRAPSTNAALANLTISAGTLSPVFATGTNSYTASVGNATASITVTPTTSDPTATVTINGTAVSSGMASGSIALVAGSNTITTIVTAQDGITTDTYTITVSRAPSTNALLSSIKLTPASTLTNTGTVGSTTTYTTSVSNAVASVTVTATTIDPTATIKVNGVAVSSGMASGSIALVAGPNTITTVVTAQDGITTRTYTIIVTRAKSTNAALAKLSISAGMLSPVFATGTNSYTASVGNATASVTVTPTTSDGTATVTVNGTAVSSGTASGGIALVVGANTITTIVTAQDGVTTKTYTITVTRAPSTNALLSGIKLTPASTLTNTGTVGSTTTYTTSVSNATMSVTVTATTIDPTATIKVNGVAVSSGMASGSIALAVGSNTINTVVTAQDGITTRTYSIIVTKAGPVASLAGVISVEQPSTNIAIENDGILVHQGLSPNGDGINDFLKIDGITAYPDNKLTIIDRNGMLIFEAKGYDNYSKVFDGHSSKTGAMQNPGTYFYSLDYVAGGLNKHLTGYIVIRY